MAVSQRTQQGMYAAHADVTRYVTTMAEVEQVKEELRATGLYRRVSHTRWNNGSRERPRWEYKVMAWAAK